MIRYLQGIKYSKPKYNPPPNKPELPFWFESSDNVQYWTLHPFSASCLSKFGSLGTIVVMTGEVGFYQILKDEDGIKISV